MRPACWWPGFAPVLLYLVPAVLAALLLITSVLIAKQGRRGGPAIAAVATVIALIGLPSNVWAVLLLHAGWHIGTMLWCLFAFAALRSGRWGVGWWIAVLFLTAGMLGDLQTLALGLGPVAVAGLVASARSRRWLAGAPAVSAAVAGFAGWWVIHTAATALGGYQTGGINSHATADQMHANVATIPSWLAQVFGVGNGEWGNSGVPSALGAVRYLALAIVAVAVVAAITSIIVGILTGDPGRPGTDQSWRIDDMLVLACLADLVFYVYAAQSDLPGYLRYLAPFVVFGSILAGRTVGRAAQRFAPGRVRQGLAAVGVAVIAVFGASFVITSVQPRADGDQLRPRDLPSGQGSDQRTGHLLAGIDDHRRVLRGGRRPAGRGQRREDRQVRPAVDQRLVRRPGIPVPGLRYGEPVGRGGREVRYRHLRTTPGQLSSRAV